MKSKTCLIAIVIGMWVLVNPAFPDESDYERVIHLKGTQNTRDIGGYEAADGRTVRWRKIIRSDNLSRATAEDFQKLEAMGLRTVIDLRTTKETTRDPTVWLGDNPPEIYHFPIGRSDGEWFKAQRKLLNRNRFTEKQMLEHMMNGYRMVAEVGTPSYTSLMELVLDESNWPILIHCAAGKDRAGIATVLILEAMGVDRETIREDFMLTNEVSRAEEKATILSKQRRNYSARVGSRMGSGKGPPPSAFFPLVGVTPEMLDTFYTSVDEQYGSFDAYLEEIGVDQLSRSTLSDSLTSNQNAMMGE